MAANRFICNGISYRGKAIGIINNPEFADVRALEGVVPTKLEAMKEEELEFLAQSAACVSGNPKAASVEDFKDLFRKII